MKIGQIMIHLINNLSKFMLVASPYLRISRAFEFTIHRINDLSKI